MNFTRRNFLKAAAVGAAAISIDARTWSRAAGSNGDIRVAQIGFRSQGAGHLATLTKMKGVRVVALARLLEIKRKLARPKDQLQAMQIAAVLDELRRR